MRVTILRNIVKNIPALEDGINQAVKLCARVGLPLNIVYQDIDQIFDSRSISSDVVSTGWDIDPQEILNAAKGSADIVCLISSYVQVKPFNFSTSNPINPCTWDLDKTTLNNTITIEICEEWYNDYPEVLTQFFLHELCHALYDKTGILPDLTHYQYANSSYSQKQPIEYYLYLISTLIPFLKSQEPIIATLTRNSDNGTETLGTLSINDFTCKTLERPWKNNIVGISCIPKGTYDVKLTFSWRLFQYTYEIQNVPNRSGIRIHTANFFSQLLGCIALGDSYGDINKDGQLDVLNSRITLNKFVSLLNKQNFKLIIQ